MRLPCPASVALSVLVVAVSVWPAAGQPWSPRQPFATFAPPAIAEPPSDLPEWWRDGGPRIRTTDASAALILRLGLERSAILRQIAAEIEAAPVIVYVGIRTDMPIRLAGRLNLAGQGGRYRYIHITLNGNLTAGQIVASLAHELQHVREIIAAPEVQDDESLTRLYRRIGRESRLDGSVGWETERAQAVGSDVRRELTSGVAAILAQRYDSARRSATP